MTLDLSSLNNNQLKAVSWADGPLLVLAGPGSGKTRVLTLRIARLIESTPDRHFKILALTFTNKAAAEMRERIEELVPLANERCLLTTFHSFAADVLRQHGNHIGLKTDFTLLTQDSDRHSLLEEAIGGRTDSKTGNIWKSDRLLPLITRLIENGTPPAEALAVLSEASLDEPENIASIYIDYRRLMISTGALDFPGLIAEALELLRCNPGVQKQIHRIYPYVCVDEFQDTNLAQSQLLELVVNLTTKNLFVVADDDQIIYQWNGASPERLWSLRNKFDMGLVQLPQNYRCPSEVVELANRLIAHNFNRSFEKQALTAHKTNLTESVIRVRKFSLVQEEASWIASDIAQRDGHSRSKCVILARTKALLDVAVSALNEAGLPGYLAIRKTEFESPPFQWLHSVLRLANSPSSREQLSRVCKAFYSLEGINTDISSVISNASAGDGNFLRGWAELVLSREELSPIARDVIRSAIYKLLERLDFWNLINQSVSWLDGLPDMRPDKEGIFSEYNDEKATWNNLVGDICAQYGKDDVTLHLLLQELDLRSKAPAVPKNGIPCFTIHSSKGMEFDHVYLMGLVEDQLPSWAAIKKGERSREMQEERRNCFVAITRAQESLTISLSERVNGWAKHPSRFLSEMGVLAH